MESETQMTDVAGSLPAGSRAAKLAALAQSVFFLERRIRLLDIGEDVVALSPLESLLVRHIDLDPGITPSTLSRKLGLSSGNTATALRSLEANGLVTKVAGKDDRRRSHLRLTDRAHHEIARVRAAWARHLDPLVPAGADLDAVLEVLDGITTGLESGPMS
ncbi:MarR family winged helix-turn-helix transcriptional regulator [Nocardia fusca]|uniref:MarR family winged helix-turn-helix transcriptional regulator n=1 Tax=Nocardia fusca TaxID=941183 RepID=UPI0037A48AEE